MNSVYKNRYLIAFCLLPLLFCSNDKYMAQLTDKNPAVRYQGLKTLREKKVLLSLGTLIPLLFDPASKVRLEALQYLSTLKIKGGEEILVQLLKDKNPFIILQAIKSLGQLKSESGYLQIARLCFETEKEGLKKTAFQALYDQGFQKTDIVKLYRRYLTRQMEASLSPNSQLCKGPSSRACLYKQEEGLVAGLRLLQSSQDTTRLPKALELLEHPAQKVRKQALDTLLALDDPNLKRYFQKGFLKSKYKEARDFGYLFLIKYLTPDKEELTKALSFENRAIAELAIQKIFASTALLKQIDLCRRLTDPVFKELHLSIAAHLKPGICENAVSSLLKQPDFTLLRQISSPTVKEFLIDQWAEKHPDAKYIRALASGLKEPALMDPIVSELSGAVETYKNRHGQWLSNEAWSRLFPPAQELKDNKDPLFAYIDKLKNPKGRQPLFDLFENKEKKQLQEKVQALIALCQAWKIPQSLEIMVRLIQAEPSEIAEAAILAVAKISPSALADSAAKILATSKNRLIQRGVLKSLPKDARYVDLVLPLLQSKSPEVLEAALDFLTAFHEPKISAALDRLRKAKVLDIPALLRSTLKNNNRELTQFLIAEALKRPIKDRSPFLTGIRKYRLRQFEPFVLKSLDSSDPLVREFAIETLTHISPKAKAQVQPYLNDFYGAVRRSARKAL